MLYMNQVILHIETPPGLTPPRLLAGGREGKVLYVEIQYLELRRIKMLEGRGGSEYPILGQSQISILYHIISFNDDLGLCRRQIYIFYLRRGRVIIMFYGICELLHDY